MRPNLSLVPFEDTPRFSFLAARRDAASDKGDGFVAAIYQFEWLINVQYALMPPLYGESILSCLKGTKPLIPRDDFFFLEGTEPS